MIALHFDSRMSAVDRRVRLFAGDIFVFSARASTLALISFARELLESAFAPHEPQTAQSKLSVERFVEIFGPVKPAFIHHPTTAELLRDIVTEFECDLDETYVDVPRLRGVTSDSYLTAGVGYAFPAHRDTWWSAPMAQINWWLPIFEFASESSMAFHPNYWTTPVQNGSEEFNYYQYNAVGRKEAAKHIKTDMRKQPGPREPMELDPQLRIICPPGGVILFSAAQMHSTVPNTSGLTRFSIDFRTVDFTDLKNGVGAPNVDSQAAGTSLRDFRRARDNRSMPDDIVAQYDSGEVPEDAVLVFNPTSEDVLTKGFNGKG